MMIEDIIKQKLGEDILVRLKLYFKVVKLTEKEITYKSKTSDLYVIIKLD